MTHAPTSEDDRSQAFAQLFPFAPYGIQNDFMHNLWRCIEDGRFGLFESPTGTGKTLSILCGVLAWLQRHREKEAAAVAGPAEQPQAAGQAGTAPSWLDDDSSDENTGPNAAVATPPSTHSRDGRGPQVIYAARTHSQLSQFMGEFAKIAGHDQFTIAAVASRKVLCVNSKVQALKAAWRINDACLDLQAKATTKKQALEGGGAKASGGCGFRCKDEPALDAFTDAIVAGTMDIEELAAQGSRRAVCPYYASRGAVQRADIVLVPYSCLIHRDTREALGLALQDSVVIIDEAHNLLPAINGAHSVTLAHTSLQAIIELLDAYLSRFQGRLGAQKTTAVTAAKRLAERILQFLLTQGGSDKLAVYVPDTFLAACKLSNVNLLEIVRGLSQDHLVLKVAGYADTLAAETAAAASATPLSRALSNAHQGDAMPAASRRASAAAAFQTFTQLLSELANSSAAGRVLLTPAAHEGGSSCTGADLKYVLLDAGSKFRETLRCARSVVLASGTLAPTELLTAQLCRPADAPRLQSFACGHVVPAERVLALGLGAGPRGRAIRLTHGARDAVEMLDECGLALANMCRIVPQGLVAFVPSFAYLDKLRTRWETAGIAAQLRARKRVFWEARDAAACEAALREYRAHLASSRTAGALLLCVVGAKLSEGINFGDGLGRCVVAFGLPYPDLRDTELKERLAHVERCAGDSAVAGGAAGAPASLGPRAREMYTNLCMQAVNQCVGRAIRHVGDYAAVVLVDARYTSADRGHRGVVGKLPGWLTQRWHDCPSSIGPALSALAAFYKSMQAQADASVQ